MHISHIRIYPKTVLLAAAFLSAISCSKSTEEPAPAPVSTDYVRITDANFRTYLLERFDTDRDGGISAAEAKAVTSIDCSSKGISSLSGIRCFTELKTLNCSDNSLTSLILSGTASTKADIPEGECSKLVTLDCSGNRITSITIDRCSELTTLNCSGNDLTSLDVSNNKNLTALDCTDNSSLTEVTISSGQTIPDVKKDDEVVIRPKEIKVTSVSLDITSVTISEGDTFTLTAAVLPDDATNKSLIWNSSYPAVAAVGTDGTVNGLSPGSAVITVTTADGGKTAACDVTVKKKSSLENPQTGDDWSW